MPCDHRGRRGRRAWRVFRLHVTSRQRCRSRSQRRRRNRWQRYLCQPQWAAGKPFNPLGAMGGGGASKAAAKDGGEAAAKDGVQDKEKGQDDEEANLSILSEENEAVRRTTPSEPPPSRRGLEEWSVGEISGLLDKCGFASAATAARKGGMDGGTFQRVLLDQVTLSAPPPNGLGLSRLQTARVMKELDAEDASPAFPPGGTPKNHPKGRRRSAAAAASQVARD